MKAYKLTVLVVDHDALGGDQIIATLQDQKYPNWCIYPQVMAAEVADIGEWTDEHPLNHRDQQKDFFKNLFRHDS